MVVRRAPPMLYVVWFEGDNPGQYEWFTIYPAKRQAMQYAKSFGTQKNVVYIKHDSAKCLADFDAATTVVVKQQPLYHHGA